MAPSPLTQMCQITQTAPFNDKALWREDGSQPFLWSTMDT